MWLPFMHCQMPGEYWEHNWEMLIVFPIFLAVLTILSILAFVHRGLAMAPCIGECTIPKVPGPLVVKPLLFRQL